jgi:hypothetical protein
MNNQSFRRDCRKSPQADSWVRCRKNDLIECATINDLIIMRGHETPENHPLTMLKGFSTVSEEALRKPVADSTYESTKLLQRGVNDYGLEVSITFKHLRLADLLMD